MVAEVGGTVCSTIFHQIVSILRNVGVVCFLRILHVFCGLSHENSCQVAWGDGHVECKVVVVRKGKYFSMLPHVFHAIEFILESEIFEVSCMEGVIMGEKAQRCLPKLGVKSLEVHVCMACAWEKTFVEWGWLKGPCKASGKWLSVSGHISGGVARFWLKVVTRVLKVVDSVMSGILSSLVESDTRVKMSRAVRKNSTVIGGKGG